MEAPAHTHALIHQPHVACQRDGSTRWKLYRPPCHHWDSVAIAFSHLNWFELIDSLVRKIIIGFYRPLEWISLVRILLIEFYFYFFFSFKKRHKAAQLRFSILVVSCVCVCGALSCMQFLATFRIRHVHVSYTHIINSRWTILSKPLESIASDIYSILKQIGCVHVCAMTRRKDSNSFFFTPASARNRIKVPTLC